METKKYYRVEYPLKWGDIAAKTFKVKAKAINFVKRAMVECESCGTYFGQVFEITPNPYKKNCIFTMDSMDLR